MYIWREREREREIDRPRGRRTGSAAWRPGRCRSARRAARAHPAAVYMCCFNVEVGYSEMLCLWILRIWTGCSFCSRSFRTVSFQNSILFLRPRPWQLEI